MATETITKADVLSVSPSSERIMPRNRRQSAVDVVGAAYANERLSILNSHLKNASNGGLSDIFQLKLVFLQIKDYYVLEVKGL